MNLMCASWRRQFCSVLAYTFMQGILAQLSTSQSSTAVLRAAVQQGHLQHEGRALQQYGDWLTPHYIRPCNVNMGCYGRLGNQLLSLFCALHTARTLHSNGHFTGGEGCYAGLLKKDPLDMPFGVTEGQCDGDLDVNGWFGRPSVDPHDQNTRDDFAYLYASMEWPAEKPAADELVIYLRAGDIFLERGPEFYLWAPCSLYDKIITDGGFKGTQVSVVTDINFANGQNPCTEYLRKKYKGLKLVSGDVGHDFGYLVHATHLVLGGVSTFGQLAAFLSPVLQHLYIFSWSEASTNNRDVEPVWASMGYFDWEGVTPHHYVVANYTARLSEAIDIMTTFNGSNIASYSGAEYWHEYAMRGVNNINPWVPFTYTLLTTCEKTKEETVTKLKGLALPWEALPGQNIQRSVPTCVFVPEGWQDLLKELDHPMKYYRVVYTPSQQHPPAEHLLKGGTEGCDSKLPLAYALQALTTNPFRTTHFLWLSHESHLESVVNRMKRVVKREQQRPLYFARSLSDGSEREELIAAILPASMFRPAFIKYEWVMRAENGMEFRDWLAHEKSKSEHKLVHWHQ